MPQKFLLEPFLQLIYFALKHFFMCLSLQEKMQMAAHNPSTSIGADGLYVAGKSIYIKCYL